MICFVEGILKDLVKMDGFFKVFVKCENGIGFELKVSFKTAEQIKNKKHINLYSHFVLRENLAELYGFYSSEEKECFKHLISVSGVGPSFALLILSSLSPLELFKCVSLENYEELCKCKGIGKKTANRIVLELKDKFKNLNLKEGLNHEINLNQEQTNVVKEAIEALVVLGYKKEIAQKAVEMQKGEKEVENLIKGALLSLNKK